MDQVQNPLSVGLIMCSYGPPSLGLKMHPYGPSMDYKYRFNDAFTWTKYGH